jgi:phage repressor protein C with HTH and peptisase S24 domain
MPKKILKQIHANIKTSHILNVSGDSMYPAIKNGDKVLADTSKKDVYNDKVYIIRVENVLMIKRLQRLPKGAIKVLSDNKEYSAFELHPNDNDYEVCAQCLWMERFM